MHLCRLQEQAAKVHEMGMRRYEDLKERLLHFTAGLVISGAILAGAVGGPDMAYPFALGGRCKLSVHEASAEGRGRAAGGNGVLLASRMGQPVQGAGEPAWRHGGPAA